MPAGVLALLQSLTVNTGASTVTASAGTSAAVTYTSVSGEGSNPFATVIQADSTSALQASAAVNGGTPSLVAYDPTTATLPALGAGQVGYADIADGDTGSGSIALPAGVTLLDDAADQAVTISGANGDGQVVRGSYGNLAFYAGTGSGVFLADGTFNPDSADHPSPASTNNLFAAPALNGGNWVVSTGSGNDTVVAGSGAMSIAAGTGDNQLFLGSGSDLVVSTGADTIQGGSGSATISAADNNVFVSGGQGALTFFNGSGSSSVLGGLGASTVIGGTGHLVLFAGMGGGEFFGGSGGGNTLAASSGNVTLAGGGNGNLYVGGSGNNLIAMSGNADAAFAGSGNTVIFGGAGSQVMIGGQGSDMMLLGSGNSQVYAGSGSSTIVGGTGSNVTFGGSGNATVVEGSGGGTFYAGSGHAAIFGNAGADLYVFVNGHAGGNDLIAGFKAGTDHLSLQGYDTGTVAAAEVQAATGSGGNTVVSLTDGTQITLVGVSGLSQGSFV